VGSITTGMSEDMRPPINRAMRTLDKAFFRKTVPISAARIFQNQNLSSCRNELVKSGDICELDRWTPIIPDVDQELAKLGKKCILLRTSLKHNGMIMYTRRSILATDIKMQMSRHGVKWSQTW
jgi:hypothetical protein